MLGFYPEVFSLTLMSVIIVFLSQLYGVWMNFGSHLFYFGIGSLGVILCCLSGAFDLPLEIPLEEIISSSPEAISSGISTVVSSSQGYAQWIATGVVSGFWWLAKVILPPVTSVVSVRLVDHLSMAPSSFTAPLCMSNPMVCPFLMSYAPYFHTSGLAAALVIGHVISATLPKFYSAGYMTPGMLPWLGNLHLYGHFHEVLPVQLNPQELPGNTNFTFEHGLVTLCGYTMTSSETNHFLFRLVERGLTEDPVILDFVARLRVVPR